MEHPQKILIVDDKPENLFALKQVLNGLDAEVIQSVCGNDALIASLNHDFALAILDVQMPEMDGYELAGLLRSQGQTRNLPIIFLSAVYHTDQYIFRGYEAGAVDFITKPYHSHVLLSKAKIFLELARQRMESKRMARELHLANEQLETRVRERTELAQARAKQLQALAVELIEAEERERRRIAEILHEDLQQLLAAARLQIESVYENLPELPELAKAEQLLTEAIVTSRRLSHELSPAVLRHSGLPAALEWLSQEMRDHFNLRVRLKLDAFRPIGSAPLTTFLFRAVQELLFNVVKHAGVSSASVELSDFDGGVVITVIDKGRGFDPAILESCTVVAGLGLLSLRERARSIGGSLNIKSAPGQGSRFTFTVPIRIDDACALPTSKQAHAKEGH